MKKTIVVIVAMIFLLTACGSNMVIQGKKVETVGIVNMFINDSSVMAVKEPGIKYKVIWGNVIWGAVLFGTVIAPIYFWGFSMFEPVGEK